MHQIMKTRYIIALSILAAVVSCNKTEQLVEPQAPGDLVTITAILPEDDAVKGAGIKTTLSWTWNEGDKITVIGETTEVFKIKPGFTPKKAEFEGIAVKGNSFTILYPGEDAAETDWNAQVQKGNNNLDHLVYQAALTDVDEYTTFAFNSEWALEHGGSLKQTGVLKLTVETPAEIPHPERLIVSADEPIFYAGNSDETLSDKIQLNLTDVTIDDGILVAWFNTAWFNVPVAAGTTLYVTVDGDEKSMSRDILFSSASELKTGFVNLFTLKGSGWSDEAVNAHYAAGRGTKLSPWIVETKEQLLCMNGDMAEGSVRYFKLGADIDLDGVAWVSLNSVDPYKKFVNFDGNGHKIKNLGAPLFDVLSGTIKNLVIENATVTGESATTAIVANTILVEGDNVIDNVDVTGSSVTASGQVGGIIGEADKPFTMTGCDVVNTSVTGTLAGGVIGFANAQATVSNCTNEGSTITGSARYVGGLVASTSEAESVFSNCSVKDVTVSATNQRVGGFAGQINKKVLVKDSKAENVTMNGGSQNVGGFAGVCYGNLTNCWSSGTLTTTATGNTANVGGLAAYFQHGTITNCYSTVAVDAKGGQIGGLVGVFQKGTIEKCYATGSVKGTYRHIGGLVGFATTGDEKVITDCYSTGKVDGNSYTGAFIGSQDAGKLTITKCYSTGDVTATGFAAGGFIGYIKTADVTIEKSVAWNATVTAGSIGEGNWSSACFSGVTFPTCTLTDNYRNPAMALTAFWVPDATYQHANVSAESSLIKQNGEHTTATGLASGQDGYPQFPYHGKVDAEKNLSALAKDVLGWSAEVWDFSGETPKFK